MSVLLVVKHHCGHSRCQVWSRWTDAWNKSTNWPSVTYLENCSFIKCLFSYKYKRCHFTCFGYFIHIFQNTWCVLFILKCSGGSSLQFESCCVYIHGWMPFDHWGLLVTSLSWNCDKRNGPNHKENSSICNPILINPLQLFHVYKCTLFLHVVCMFRYLFKSKERIGRIVRCGKKNLYHKSQSLVAI